MELLPQRRPAEPWLGGFEVFRKKQAGGWSLPQRCSSPRQGPAQLGLSEFLLGRIAASSVLVGRAERGCPLASEGVSVGVCSPSFPRLTHSSPGASDKPRTAPFTLPVGPTKKKRENFCVPVALLFVVTL